MSSRSEDQLLVSAARLMVGISVRAADQIGEASLVQLRALTVLDDADGANLMQLADGMGVTVSTTSRLVDRLVAAGLVDRRPSEVTRREVSITLTAAGESVLHRYDDLRLRELRGRLSRLEPDRRDVVLHGLRELVSTTPEPVPSPAHSRPTS